MKASLFGGAAILLLTSSAMAQEPQQQAASDAASQEKKICKTEKMTGSLTRSRRICLTRAEWQELQNRTKRGVDRMTGDSSGGCQAPSNPLQGSMC
ncbi:MAG: hypothetical protein J7493_14425 [Porphyrobacter sp.]|nr:hypothetical protein [Porphyrobacter sp.]